MASMPILMCKRMRKVTMMSLVLKKFQTMSSLTKKVDAKYEIDFGEVYVTQIERLDTQANTKQAGKTRKWEVLKLKSDVKIEGCQFAAI